MPRTLLLLALLTLGGAQSAPAQLQVQGLRDLAFGMVVGGVPKAVSPDDPDSGLFRIDAAIGDRLRVRFTLPSALVGPGGATMPISFGGGDGRAQGTAPSSTPLYFNPRGTQNWRLVTSATVLVNLGGTVSPGPALPAGIYSNTIVMTVIVLCPPSPLPRWPCP